MSACFILLGADNRETGPLNLKYVIVLFRFNEIYVRLLYLAGCFLSVLHRRHWHEIYRKQLRFFPICYSSGFQTQFMNFLSCQKR